MPFRFLRATLLTWILLVVCRCCEGGSHQQGSSKVVAPEHNKKRSHHTDRPKRSRSKDWKEDRFPYVCSIRQRGSRSFVCSGVLMEPEWVITAASCVDPTVAPLGLHPIVYCGTYSKEAFDRKKLFIGKGVIHPDWTGDYRKGYDIALVKLNRKSKVAFPEISSDTSGLPPGTPLTALGWTSKASGVLQMSTNLPYIGREACQKSVSFQLPDHAMCVRIKADDTLKEDAGGPLLIPDQGESLADGLADLDFVVGIASGHTADSGNSIALYTSIGHFWDWIEHVVHGKPFVHKTVVETEHSPESVVPTITKPWGSRYAGLAGKDLMTVFETVSEKIESGDAAAVRQFLGEGLNPESVNGSVGPTLLHQAARYCCTKCIEVLIEFGAHVDARKYLKETPLHDAVGYECLPAVKVLLTDRADIEALDGYKATPLLVSCRGYRWKVAEFLIDKGANIHARDDMRSTALHYASHAENDHMIKLLLSKGAEVDARDSVGRTPLFIVSYFASGYSTTVLVMKTLLDAGASKTAKANDGRRPYDVVCKFSGFCTDAYKKQLRDLLDPTDHLFEEERSTISTMHH